MDRVTKPLILEKLLQQEGCGSRKQCRTLILQARVRVQGEICTNPQALFAADGQILQIDDGELWTSRRQLTIILHKPTGFECSHAPQHHPSIDTLLPARLRARGLQSVGRLDQDTSGLLFLSDDGALNHALTSPKRACPKLYRVDLADNIEPKQIAALQQGVILRDDPKPAHADSLDILTAKRVLLGIHEGRYHQVKRMFAAVGNRVTALHREAMAGVRLPDDLAEGCWREISTAEAAKLAQFLK